MYKLESRSLQPTRFKKVGETLLGLLLFAVALPAADLSIASEHGSPGDTVTMPVNFRAAKSPPISALQFDLVVDRSVITISSATVGSAGAAAGKLVQYAALADGSYRFIIFGLNQTAIGDGSIVDLGVSINPNARRGSYQLDWRNVIASSPEGNAVPLATRGTAVLVVNPKK